MKNVISNFKSNVNNSMSSIFTKEDVIKMLTEMESQTEDSSPSSNVEGLEEIFQKFKVQVESIKSDVEDLEVSSDEIEFSIDGREIVVDDVEIRGKDQIVDDIETLITDIEDEIEKVFFKKIS